MYLSEYCSQNIQNSQRMQLWQNEKQDVWIKDSGVHVEFWCEVLSLNIYQKYGREIYKQQSE